MITLTDQFGNSVTINPAQVVYVQESTDYTSVNFVSHMVMVKESYLEVVGQLKANTGGCCQ
jgi:uncharacterized protein YlzI (FlbEa/FlbD family)